MFKFDKEILMSRESSVSNEFLCPITREVMSDPVVAADGHTYERAAIVEWFALGHLMSPMTGINMDNTALIPNINLKKMIKDQQGDEKVGDESYTDYQSILTLIMDRLKSLELRQQRSGPTSNLSDSGDNEAAAAASFAAMKQPSAPSISLFDNESRTRDKEKLNELLQLVVNGSQVKAKKNY